MRSRHIPLSVCGGVVNHTLHIRPLPSFSRGARGSAPLTGAGTRDWLDSSHVKRVPHVRIHQRLDALCSSVLTCLEYQASKDVPAGPGALEKLRIRGSLSFAAFLSISVTCFVVRPSVVLPLTAVSRQPTLTPAVLEGSRKPAPRDYLFRVVMVGARILF